MMKIKPARRVTSIPRSLIHEMTRLSSQLDDVAFLSWAKPTTNAPDHIRREAARAIEAGLTDGYSVNAGLPQLRGAVVEKLRRDNGIEAESSQVMVTVGAIEGLMSALLAVVDPGDEVILPSPTYSTHINQVMLASAVPVFAPSVEEDGFGLNLDAIRAAITPRTRAVLYCSPCNPTGAVFGEDELRGLAEIALEHDLVVITDEAYEYFVFDGARHFSIGSIPEMRRNAISCFTLTKTYAMTGWRVGYLHADEEWIGQIGKPHIACCICAPVASQYAALAALEGPQDCVREFREHYRAARDLMCKRLDRLPQLFDYQKPKGSYLMFPRIKVDQGHDSKAFCIRMLEEAGVSTTPGADFGSTGEGHLRMSFCVPEEVIDKAFDQIEEWFVLSRG